MSDTAVSGVAPPATTAGVRFLGNGMDFFQLLARGALFLLITLGIYRFWLATDVRRYLWSNTEVAGEPLEYTGTAVELLIGFLIAIAILVPIYASFFLASLGLGAFGQFMSSIAFVLLAVFGQYAIYRARRYRLTRTIFRGVRFHQDGSAWLYAFKAMLWWFLTAVTLGLAYPWMESRLERYKMRHTYYGSLQGSFAGSGWRLFLRGLPMWIVVVLPLVALVVALPFELDLGALQRAAAQGGKGTDVLSRVEGSNPQAYVAVLLLICVPLWSIVMAAVLYPAFQATVLRWWASGLRFGEIVVTSKLRLRHIYGAYMRCLGWSLLYALVVFGLGFVLIYVIRSTGLIPMTPKSVQILVSIIMVGLYVFSMLGLSAIYQATVKLSLWRFGAESLELSGIAALDQVTAAGTPSSPVGEGLADALNVGGF
jgi:uncharacterized membrane protein YjgN (DUF898 family)